MMKLHPIERNSDLSIPLALLAEGFPDRPAEFWRAGFERAAGQGAASGVPAGQLLVSKGVPAGVILTFGSVRPGRAEPIVNLSAWYVREAHRFLAPAMLKSVCAGSATFTDLTPTPQVARLSQSIGFRPLSALTAVMPLPFGALKPGQANVRPWRELELPAMLQELAEAHERLGCVALGVVASGEPSLFVARRVSYFRTPSFETVYVQRRNLVKAIGPISRALIAKGGAFLLFDCESRADAPAGAFFRRTQAARLVKGQGFDRTIDYAWSELPFLNP